MQNEQIRDVFSKLYGALSAVQAAVYEHIEQLEQKPKPKHVVGWINVRRDYGAGMQPGQLAYYGGGLIFATEADAKKHYLRYGATNPITTVKVEFDDLGVE